MAITESKTTKTLADVDASSYLSAQPPTSESLLATNNDNATQFAKQVSEINEEDGVDNIGSSVDFNGVRSHTKAVYNGNFDVEVSSCGTVFGSKFTEISGSIPNIGENCCITEEKGCKKEIVSTVDRDCGYAVGDFVWGKIRNLYSNYSWWPGRIYDPSDASDFAAKYKRDDHSLLVAYFGDGSFSWCNPSQLKPFAKNFVEMSKQSGSKIFVNALQEALDEIGWVVGLKLGCSCVPQEHFNRVGTRRANAGIKPGVVVSEANIGEEFIELLNEPTNLLASVRNSARLACSDNLLEVTLLKSWLTVFNRCKGLNTLPFDHEPKYIEGLEHGEESEVKAEEENDDFNPMNLWVQVPFEVNSEKGDVKLERVNNSTRLSSRKRKQVSGDENDNVEDGKEHTGKISLRRNKKRSRYLSYPYTQFPEEVDIEDETIDEVQKTSCDSVELYPDSKLSEDEGSRVGCVRQKLEKMLSIIQDGASDILSAEKKSELERETKELLEMVTRMIDMA